jgi:hypothetical protein
MWFPETGSRASLERIGTGNWNIPPRGSKPTGRQATVGNPAAGAGGPAVGLPM